MGGVGGFSPVGAACQGERLVVKTRDIKNGIWVLTHELGHMLGSRHDDDTSCRGDYVMMSSGSWLSRGIKFSQCSKNAITAKLPDYECLRNPDGKSGPSDNNSEKSGNARGNDGKVKKQTKPEARKKNLNARKK